MPLSITKKYSIGMTNIAFFYVLASIIGIIAVGSKYLLKKRVLGDILLLIAILCIAISQTYGRNITQAIILYIAAAGLAILALLEHKKSRESKK
jgi:hypothetical protein